MISQKDKIKAFTFLRDPLELSLSFYYYSKKEGRMELSLEEYITTHKNRIAYFLNCDETNYNKILERYFFVGNVENMNESVFKLSRLTGKRFFDPPLLNKTERDSR